MAGSSGAEASPYARMHIEHWTGPPVDTNAYLIYDEVSREAWAVDAPLETAAPLMERARRRGLTLTRLVLTHGHFDHVLDAGRYREAGVPVAAHPLEATMLALPQTRYFELPYEMPRIEIDRPLEEGDEAALGDLHWRVWHVPGHSPGHLLLHLPEAGIVIGGDMLFRDGYGRVDLPLSNPDAMCRSLERMAALPDETRVYAGHGPVTTIGRERAWLEPMLRSRSIGSPM